MAHGDEIARLADRAVAQLRLDLAGVIARLTKYLAELLKAKEGGAAKDKAELAAKLGKDLVRVLREVGYDQAVEEVVTSFERIAAADEAYLAGKLGRSFTAASSGNLARLVDGTVEHLIRQKGKAAERMREVLVVAVTSNAPVEALVEKLAQTARLTLTQGIAEVSATTMAFHNEALVSEAQRSGFDLFEVVGPDDEVNRPWCAEHVGNVYTAKDLDEDDNGPRQPKPVSRFLGGYNCRHSLAPVTVAEAAALGRAKVKGPEARRIVFGGKAGPAESAWRERALGTYDRGELVRMFRKAVRVG